jgi:hypothetical protein
MLPESGDDGVNRGQIGLEMAQLLLHVNDLLAELADLLGLSKRQALQLLEVLKGDLRRR